MGRRVASRTDVHGPRSGSARPSDLEVARSWYHREVVRFALILVTACALAASGRADPRPAYLPGPSTVSRPSAPPFPLRREPGRGWVYEHPAFYARIAEDGSVRFQDRHGELHLALPLPLPLPEGTPTLEGSLRRLVNPSARRRPPPTSPEVPAPVPRMSPYRPDPFEWCVYPQPCFFTAAVTFVNVAGTFDLTDEILRLTHKDPYRNLKASFLASTLAFRQELGARASERARTQALEDLRRRLDAIGNDRRLGPNERTAAMRALAEDLDPVAAAPARALIEARLHGPPSDGGAR
jgi:hypothetical protein